jgi:hypothetical protein
LLYVVPHLIKMFAHPGRLFWKTTKASAFRVCRGIALSLPCAGLVDLRLWAWRRAPKFADARWIERQSREDATARAARREAGCAT